MNIWQKVLYTEIRFYLDFMYLVQQTRQHDRICYLTGYLVYFALIPFDLTRRRHKNKKSSDTQMNKWLEWKRNFKKIFKVWHIFALYFIVKMAEEQSTTATENVPGSNPKDLSQVVQGTAENLLNKLEENLGEQKGEPP